LRDVLPVDDEFDGTPPRPLLPAAAPRSPRHSPAGYAVIAPIAVALGADRVMGFAAGYATASSAIMIL